MGYIDQPSWTYGLYRPTCTVLLLSQPCFTLQRRSTDVSRESRNAYFLLLFFIFYLNLDCVSKQSWKKGGEAAKTDSQ